MTPVKPMVCQAYFGLTRKTWQAPESRKLRGFWQAFKEARAGGGGGGEGGGEGGRGPKLPPLFLAGAQGRE